MHFSCHVSWSFGVVLQDTGWACVLSLEPRVDSPGPVCGSPCLTQAAVMLAWAILLHHKESIAVPNCQAPSWCSWLHSVHPSHMAWVGTWLEFCCGPGLESSVPARLHCVHCQFRHGLCSVWLWFALCVLTLLINKSFNITALPIYPRRTVQREKSSNWIYIQPK